MASGATDGMVQASSPVWDELSLVAIARVVVVVREIIAVSLDITERFCSFGGEQMEGNVDGKGRM
jgi:hypothetical protein